MQASKTFLPESHAQFAMLTGDYNPMHMDPVQARRTQAGAPVVHGMHTLLWLLDCVAADQFGSLPAATALKARLLKMVYVGERVDAEIIQQSKTALRARALVGGVEVVSLFLDFSVVTREFKLPSSSAEQPMAPPAASVELSLDEMSGRAGRLRFAGSSQPYVQMFPHAAAYLGMNRVAALGCTSCLVGMVVPGLHSVYGGMDVLFVDEADRSNELEYEVLTVDERYRLIRMAIRGGGLLGTIDSASRLAPVRQPSITSVAQHIARNECHDVKALVVGGSRGIGEVTAKLIAAAGGDVIVTYCSGRADADGVAGEIRDWGGRCDVVQYDARAASAPQLRQLSGPPSQVYYFATPLIAARKSGLCDAQRLNEFNAFYVAGFLDLVESCRRLRPQGLCVFYPSTVYVESRPGDMTEYAMSKAAGEVLCDDIGKYLPGVRVLRQRLPRLPTDQTGSLLPVPMADPLQVMLPIIKQMQLLDSAVAAGEK